VSHNHIFTKFNTRKFYKSLSTNSNFGLNLVKTKTTLGEPIHPTFLETVPMLQVSKSSVPVSHKLQFRMPNDIFDNVYKHLTFPQQVGTSAGDGQPSASHKQERRGEG
jgi:hypothetical protein